MWVKAGSLALGAISLLGTAFAVRQTHTAAPVAADGPRATFTRSGRDLAFIQAIQGAHESIYLRTSDLELVPFANELGQKAQAKVSVRVELPMTIGRRSQDLVNYLMGASAVVEVGSDPWTSYQGAYMKVDDKEFYYSAAPIVYSPQLPVSFVHGRP